MKSILTFSLIIDSLTAFIQKGDLKEWEYNLVVIGLNEMAKCENPQKLFDYLNMDFYKFSKIKEMEKIHKKTLLKDITLIIFVLLFPLLFYFLKLRFEVKLRYVFPKVFWYSFIFLSFLVLILIVWRKLHWERLPLNLVYNKDFIYEHNFYKKYGAYPTYYVLENKQNLENLKKYILKIEPSHPLLNFPSKFKILVYDKRVLLNKVKFLLNSLKNLHISANLNNMPSLFNNLENFDYKRVYSFFKNLKEGQSWDINFSKNSSGKEIYLIPDFNPFYDFSKNIYFYKNGAINLLSEISFKQYKAIKVFIFFIFLFLFVSLLRGKFLNNLFYLLISLGLIGMFNIRLNFLTPFAILIPFVYRYVSQLIFVIVLLFIVFNFLKNPLSLSFVSFLLSFLFVKLFFNIFKVELK